MYQIKNKKHSGKGKESGYYHFCYNLQTTLCSLKYGIGFNTHKKRGNK